jgi:DNA polymerase-4
MFCAMDGPPRATILHADLDAFYASVEQRDNVRLRGRPLIVGGGVVLSASYEARRFGVFSPMGVTKALRLCPNAIVVGPRFSAYVEASRAVFDIFEHTTPVVEGLSIDEAFLDVRGLELLSGSPETIATRLRQEVRDSVGLPITVGIARTKHLAKVASGVAKPDGLLVVPPDHEIDFLHPLGVERLWGVGPITARKLHDHGLTTVGQLAHIDQSALVEIVGRAAGHHLHALANNLDPRPVHVGRRRRSIGSQNAIGRRRRSREEIDTLLIGIVDRVTRRLRGARRVTRTIILRLRFDDFTRATRSHTLPQATFETRAILDAARDLMATAMPLIERDGLTLVGLSLTNLENEESMQLALPFQRRTASANAVDAVIDRVRDRFGNAAITRAVLLGRTPEEEWSIPLLRD